MKKLSEFSKTSGNTEGQSDKHREDEAEARIFNRPLGQGPSGVSAQASLKGRPSLS